MYNETNNHKYLGCLIETYLKKQFDLSLAPAQLEVLTKMLAYNNVLFVHGRAVGATFILAALSAILLQIDSDINMAIASETIRQAEMVKQEFKRKFNKYKLKSPNIVTIDKALSNKYDVVLLDEMTNISKNNAESLVTHIKNKSISKVIAVCSGYRTYFHIANVASCMYSDDNSVVLNKCYEDMPSCFFDPNNIEEIKASFEYEEEFNMDYKGYII